MKLFITKENILSGTSYSEIYPKALNLYKSISKRSKRRPYIRSLYFEKSKVFLDYFWEHLRGKNFGDRVRRLKFYSCALDLIRYSSVAPECKINPIKKSEILYRFGGQTREKIQFIVQIKENKNGQKHFLSVFPRNS